MEETMLAIVFLLIFGIIGVIIYLSVDFNKYKASDAERAAREKLARQEDINYVIDEANTKSQDIYNELKDQVNSTQQNVNAFNKAFQMGPLKSGSGTTATSGTGTTVTTTGLAQQSTTASGGLPVTAVGGRVPDVNIMGKVNAVNGLETTDFAANGEFRVKNQKPVAMMKLEGAGGTGSVDVAAGGGLMNLVSGAQWKDNKWVYDGTRNSTRLLLHDDVITMNTPTTKPSAGSQVTYKEQVRVHDAGMNVRDNAWVGGKMHAQNSMTWNPGWNWHHIYRNSDDQLFFGGDDTNRGIWSHGKRPVGVYTEGKPRLSVANDGMVRVNRSEADKYPAGWSRGGLHAFDGYFNATVAVGQDGGVTSMMNNNGVYVNKEGTSWMDRWGNVLAGKSYDWNALMEGQTGNIYSRHPGTKKVNGMMTPYGIYTGDNWNWRAGMDGKSGNIWNHGSIYSGGDHIHSGPNRWISHSPDDGRHVLYISPTKRYDSWEWDWNKGIALDEPNNKVIAKGNLCVGNTCINEDQLKKIKTAASA
jgi:hypothetical protein